MLEFLNNIYKNNKLVSNVLMIITIVLVYFYFTKYYDVTKIENFEDKIEKEKNNYLNYLKLKETYIENEPEDTKLDLLYTNYTGEEFNKDTWKNKTFDQCIDTCNKLDNCIGFNRDDVLDTEPATCYPRTKIQNCYSNRKGNNKQMSNAIKFNSYVKSTYPNTINTCIGDPNLTLNRIIVIKSYAMPNQYIGNNGDSRVSMIDINTNEIKQKCNFRIEPGKDGVGTVSFLHIATNKYLYRNNDDNLIFKDINNKTEDKQRCSFNINDGLSNGIMFKVMPIEGETTDKYIIIDNTYLKISKIKNTKNNNNDNNTKTNKSSKALATFFINDNIIESNIITDRNKLPVIETTIPATTQPISKQPTTTQSKSTKPSVVQPTISNGNQNTLIPKLPSKTSSNLVEQFNDKVDLDTSNNLELYNTIFNQNNTDRPSYLTNYLEDKYLASDNNAFLTSISKKLNSGVVSKVLDKSLSKNEKMYKLLTDLNKEIENELNNNNMDLNAKNDTIVNRLDKMRIADLANDYFFIKNISTN